MRRRGAKSAPHVWLTAVSPLHLGLAFPFVAFLPSMFTGRLVRSFDSLAITLDLGFMDYHSEEVRSHVKSVAVGGR